MKRKDKLNKLNPSISKKKIVKQILLTLVIGLHLILFSSCHETISVIDGETLFLDFEGVTIKLSQFDQTAFTYWVKNGDELFLEWDSIGVLIDREREMCTIDNYSTKESCSYCEACLNMQDCNTTEFSNSVPMKMGFATDFIRIKEPTTSFDVSNAFYNACRTRPELSASFTPEKSGLYFLYGKGMNFKGGTGGEAKIQVLDAIENQTQSIKYKLSKQRIGSTDYWLWEMPDTTIWADKFSNNVKIQKIRIFNNNETIRPSRISFHPNFNGTIIGNTDDVNGCYSNVNNLDDDSIFLNDCKKSPAQNLNRPPEIKNVTPNFDNTQSGGKLTWLVEFNTNQGGDDATEVSDLEIEFMIEANNQ